MFSRRRRVQLLGGLCVGLVVVVVVRSATRLSGFVGTGLVTNDSVRAVAFTVALAGVAVAVMSLWLRHVSWRELGDRRRLKALTRGALYSASLWLVVELLVAVDWNALQEALFDPEIAGEQFPDIVTIAAKNTIVFTAFAFGGGLAIGLLVALMRLSSVAAYRWSATVYIEVFRGIPALLTIIFIRFGLPLAMDIRLPGQYTAGGVALAVVAGAYMAETIRAGIEAVPKGQTEAARSLGMSAPRAMVSVVIPQAFRIIVPPLTNELVLLLKDTSLLAVLGTTEATEEITQYARTNVTESLNATPLVVAGLVYLAITIPLTQLSRLLERRMARAR